MRRFSRSRGPGSTPTKGSSPDGRLRLVWRLHQGRLVAVETLNEAGLHMLSRRLIAAGLTPPASLLDSADRDGLKQALSA